MTTEDKLKNLIICKYGSMVNFSKEIDMANSTLATIMKNGIHKASVNNVIKICQALGISADELAHNKIVPVNSNIKNSSRNTELNELIEHTQENINKCRFLTIDGKPMSNEEIELLFDCLNLTIGLIKKRRSRGVDEK